MIFVTLGTQDKDFSRLLFKLEELKKNKKIKEKIIVQSGHTNFNSNYMTICDFFSMEEFDNYVAKCDILVTHAGVGSILTGLKNNKKVIAVPRLKKYKEHTNDHQIQIVRRFNEHKYIIGIENIDEMEQALKRVKTFKPEPYTFDNSKIKKIITNYINNN